MKSVTLKLGNMRQAQEFVIYPQDKCSPEIVIVQSDKRIAKVDLTNGKALLSDGKGGHQGFIKLNRAAGATIVDVPANMLEQLRGAVKDEPQVGPTKVVG